jgi:hypothetical protein
MKKAIFTICAACMIHMAAAQTNTATGNQNNQIKVPEQITSKFNIDYPNAKPTWAMDGSYYTATYQDQELHLGRSFTYDKNGNLMRTDRELNGTSYPPAIDDYYLKNHPNEKYKIWSSEDNTGMTSYYSKRDGKTLWFDHNGTYMSSPENKTKK